MIRILAIAALLLAGCAAPKPRTVVVMGNATAPSVCDRADANAERVRAERWKVYAEQLETRLGIPHEAIQ